MYELTGWKRKAVLIFKSEKRLGAKQIFGTYSDKSYEDMKNTILDEADLDWERYEDKVRIKDLYGHLNKVKKEFIGQSELCFYHALLIILLRRGYEIKDTFAEFENLWYSETDYLLNHLSLRWIISACDTFVDFSASLSDNPARAGVLMNAVTLVNTLKVYETQNFLTNEKGEQVIIPKQAEKFKQNDQPLYAGLTHFRIGSDDTLKHMRQRYENFGGIDELATRILLAVFDKLQNLNTAFAFLKSLHTDDKSQWWQPDTHKQES